MEEQAMTAKIKNTFWEEQELGKKEIDIPEDQTWLYVMLARQTLELMHIRKMLQAFAVLLIIEIIVQGCNLVMGF